MVLGSVTSTMATPNKVTPEVAEKILALWQEGRTQTVIAAMLGLHRTTVTTHIRSQLGVTTPTWEGTGRIAVQRPHNEKPLPTFVPPPNPPRLAVPCEICPGEAARFWVKVGPPIERGCRIWQASYSGDRGQFGSYVNGKVVNDTAYRVAWRLTFGPLPRRVNINHTCDVRGCCEPDHLWRGTQGDNMKDMAAKGRRRGRRDGQKGEDNVTAKLTWEIVREIRQLRETKGLTLDQLAARFKISKSQASNICAYRQWVEDAATDDTTSSKPST